MRVREYVFRFDYGAFWMGRPMALGSPHTRVSPATLALFLASAPCLRFALGCWPERLRDREWIGLAAWGENESALQHRRGNGSNLQHRRECRRGLET